MKDTEKSVSSTSWKIINITQSLNKVIKQKELIISKWLMLLWLSIMIIILLIEILISTPKNNIVPTEIRGPINQYVINDSYYLCTIIFWSKSLINEVILLIILFGYLSMLAGIFLHVNIKMDCLSVRKNK